MLAAPLHRRSIRLLGRDYSWPGTYFVTVCTNQRKCILGRVEEGAMCENLLGRLARNCWLEIPTHFAGVKIDAFVVMPNHVHGIIHLHRRVAANEEQYKLAQFAKPQTNSIGWIVRSFKARVTRDARLILHRPEFLVWQKNYFERVIRDGREHNDAFRYIQDNPKNWQKDEENLTHDS